MGIPAFDGDWSAQPTMWRKDCLREAAFALSLAHVLNENKRVGMSPLAVREIWAYWDESAGSPKEFRLALFWGPRPGAKAPKGSQAPWAGETEASAWARDERESREFWVACAQERDEGHLLTVFQNPKSALAKKGRRFALIYRDDRIGDSPQLSRHMSRLWLARRKSLMEASGEVGSLLRSVGSAIAQAALGDPVRRLGIEEVAAARERGEELARRGLARAGMEGHEIEYDFACREAGEMAAASDAVRARALMLGFFGTLVESGKWSELGGSGEQEMFFTLLCRIEPKWNESLDAIARVRRMGHDGKVID